MFDDELQRIKPGSVTPGEDISHLPVADLEERITLLKGEIARAEAMIAHKQDKLAAADAVFRKA
jgi:uncharacterized small protein (DUF1192 family)